MRRLAIALGVSALAMGASTAQAAGVTAVNQQATGLEECVENAKAALREVIEGTPQPQTCDL